MRIVLAAQTIGKRGIRWTFHVEESRTNVWQYIALTKLIYLDGDLSRIPELVAKLRNLIERLHKHGNWIQTKRPRIETISVYPFRILRTQIIRPHRVKEKKIRNII